MYTMLYINDRYIKIIYTSVFDSVGYIALVYIMHHDIFYDIL